MYRLVFIPDRAIFDAATPARWRLHGNDGSLLREGCDPPAAMPRAETTVAVVPQARLALIETPLPAVSAERRERLLQFAIEDRLTRDPATVHAVVLGEAAGERAGAGRHYVVAAVERDWFGAALTWLEAAGAVPLAVADTQLLPVADDEWRVEIDGTRGVAVRADRLAHALDCADLAVPPFALKLALNEAAIIGVLPKKIIVGATAADAARLDLHRWRADFAGNEATRDIVLMPAPPAAVAFDPARWRAGNLRRGAFAAPDAMQGWRQALRPALVLAACLLALHIGLTAIDAWRLARQRAGLEVEMRELFKASFPDATAIVDPALQMRRNLDALRRKRGLDAAPLRLSLARAVEWIGEANAKVSEAEWSGSRWRLRFAPLTTAEFQRLDAARRGEPRLILQGDAARAELMWQEAAP